MMKNIILLSITFSILGCSSVSDFKSNGPQEVFVSNKDAATLSQCVLLGWQNNNVGLFWYGQSYIQPLGDGYSVYSDGNAEIADFKPKNGVTEISYYYHTSAFQRRIDARKNAVKDCL